MTSIKTAKESIDSLLKIANDMVNLQDEAAEQKASPEDVLEALNAVISQLTAVAEALPVSESPEAQGAEPEGPNPQVAQLQAQLDEVTQKLARKEKEELASKYAELFDEKEHATRFDEVMKSDKPAEIWTAKIEALEEVRGQLPQSQFAKNFSYTKVAKQNSSELFTI